MGLRVDSFITKFNNASIEIDIKFKITIKKNFLNGRIDPRFDMVKNQYNFIRVRSEEKQVILPNESIGELIGILPNEILKILCSSYPEGKNFKDLKKNIEEKLENWPNKKNKNSSFTDQAIYYQLRKLKELGFIDTFSEKNLDISDRYVTNQIYKLVSLQFVFNLKEPESQDEIPLSNIPLKLDSQPNFLSNFNDNGNFNGYIVLGENSRDAPYLGSIFLLLNKIFDLKDLSMRVVYDTNEHKNTSFLSQNLVLLGGPNANTMFQTTVPSVNNEHKTLHESLPVKFLHAPESGIVINESGKEIFSKDRSMGVIQLIDNPWNLKNKILTIGGARRVGTEALVRELVRSFDKIDIILSKGSYCLVEALVDENDKFIDSRLVD